MVLMAVNAIIMTSYSLWARWEFYASVSCVCNYGTWSRFFVGLFLQWSWTVFRLFAVNFNAFFGFVILPICMQLHAPLSNSSINMAFAFVSTAVLMTVTDLVVNFATSFSVHFARSIPSFVTLVTSLTVFTLCTYVMLHFSNCSISHRLLMVTFAHSLLRWFSFIKILFCYNSYIGLLSLCIITLISSLGSVGISYL